MHILRVDFVLNVATASMLTSGDECVYAEYLRSFANYVFGLLERRGASGEGGGNVKAVNVKAATWKLGTATTSKRYHCW